MPLLPFASKVKPRDFADSKKPLTLFNVFSIFSGGFTGDVLFCNKSYTYDNIPCIFLAGNKNIPWSAGNTSESLRV